MYMLSTRDPLQIYRYKWTESERMEKGIPGNGNQRKAGVAILTSEIIDFKIKMVTRDKKRDIT